MGIMIKLVLCTNSLVSDTNFHPMFHSLVQLLIAFDLSHCQFNFPEYNDLVLHLSVVINSSNSIIPESNSKVMRI